MTLFELPIENNEHPNFEWRGKGGVWILLFPEVTLFEYNVSTILLLIVCRSPFSLSLIFVSHVKGSLILESKCMNSWLTHSTIVLVGE